MPPPLRPKFYIGLMSGTSMDAIDAALCCFSPFQLIATHSIPIPPHLKERMSTFSLQKQSLSLFGETDTEMGQAFGACCLALLEKSGISPDTVTAIGSHGQTVLHAPQGPFPFTLQIGNPHLIATMTGITTIADFRRRDIALGGQGAPFAPAFHYYLFRSPVQDRIVINIGGIANLTFLPCSNNPVIGFDTGPGNTLLDIWCWQHQKKSFDEQGQWGASGHIQKELLESMLKDPYFKQSGPKSTGREYFNDTWLQTHLHQQPYAPVDVQATLTALTATTITDAVIGITHHQPCDIFLCGGGVYNTFLFQHIQKQLPGYTVQSTAAVGLDPKWVEAATFAWLAKQTLAGQPGNLPSVTGARQAAILGAIYPSPAKWEKDNEKGFRKYAWLNVAPDVF